MYLQKTQIYSPVGTFWKILKKNPNLCGKTGHQWHHELHHNGSKDLSFLFFSVAFLKACKNCPWTRPTVLAAVLEELLFRVEVDGWMDPLLSLSGSLWFLWGSDHTWQHTNPHTRTKKQFIPLIKFRKRWSCWEFIQNLGKVTLRTAVTFHFPLILKSFNSSSANTFLLHLFSKEIFIIGVRDGIEGSVFEQYYYLLYFTRFMWTQDVILTAYMKGFLIFCFDVENVTKEMKIFSGSPSSVPIWSWNVHFQHNITKNSILDRCIVSSVLTSLIRIQWQSKATRLVSTTCRIKKQYWN